MEPNHNKKEGRKIRFHAQNCLKIPDEEDNAADHDEEDGRVEEVVAQEVQVLTAIQRLFII